MEQYIIKGGNPLVGEVEIGGAKNAALAILAAAIMTDETVQIDNLPDVNDVNVMLEAIEGIGAMVQRIDRHTVKINGSTIGDFNIEYDYIKKIRASYYLLGALLGKYKRAEVALPGGCNIGSRPIDQHLKGFRALGADVDIEHGKIVAEAEKLRGTHLYFDVVTVGATITGEILGYYEQAMAAMPILITFIPMLMGTGGNCGSQSSTLIIRGLAVGEIEFSDIFKVIFKEIRVALVVGTLLAFVNGVRICIMYDRNIMLAVALGITMIAVVMMAKCIGCILPLLAKKIGLDPAIMAAPLITTILDTCTILVYFNIVTTMFRL